MVNKDNYLQTLEQLKEQGNYRAFPVLNHNLLDLCSNDYLGLNTNKELYSEFYESLGKQPISFSATSSRLLSGNTEQHMLLEQSIQQAYMKESCLLFNSGYHANIGILPALTTKNDLIIADKLVHASLIDGAKLSQAQFMRFNHLNYEHLVQLLEKHRDAYEQVFIVSESIFSMDGDLANLKLLVEIKNKYNCLLYVDEAHALGVRGKNGLGCVEEDGVIAEVDFVMGTFGKALASLGAFVVCDEVFKHYMINHSRSLIFTTALPPVNLAWTLHVFNRLPQLQHLRNNLNVVSSHLGKLLNIEAKSQIIPFVIGENHAAIEVSGKLKQNGFNVLPVRYPTVPKGTARLRFSLRANIQADALNTIKDILLPYA